MSLDNEMRQVLVEMSVLSEASAAQLGDVVHGGQPDNAPRGPDSVWGWYRELEAREEGPNSRRLLAAARAACHSANGQSRSLAEWWAAVYDHAALAVQHDVVAAARVALAEARRTPTALEPERGTFFWKCRVADDQRDIKTVAVYFGIGSSTVSLYRRNFRGVVRGITETIDMQEVSVQ